MTKISAKEMLGISEIVEEIKRHLWIESERAGRDIGFDDAARDWIKRYSKDWLDYHRPGEKAAGEKNAEKKTVEKAVKKKVKSVVKKRRAKSYCNK